MAAKREQRRIVAYLDGLSPAGDLRSERVKELPAPMLFVGGSVGAAVGRVTGGVAPYATLRGYPSGTMCCARCVAAAPYGDDIPQGDDVCVGCVMCMSDRVH
jgi:hypothetical protein